MQTELRFPMKRFIAFVMMIIVGVGSAATVMAASVSATIVVDGNTSNIQVLSTETEDILKQANIQVRANDIVTRSDDNGIVITVKKAFDTQIDADGHIFSQPAYRGETVADALERAGITLGANDKVTPGIGEMLSTGDKIVVTRRYNITISADGLQITKLAESGTVGDALLEAGILLGEHDIVNVERSVSLREGMNISVSRVSYRTVTAEEPIPFEVISKPTDTLYQGITQIETAGKDGLQKVEKREKLVDGVVVDTEILSSQVITEPVAQVVQEGTKVKPSSYATVMADGSVYDQNGVKVNYSKYLTGKCSAYTSNGGYTSTGAKAARGLVAVDPKVIPYGTKLFICSEDGKTVYGYATAADTGGAMLSGRILVDLYYDTVAECYQFGVRNMRVYVLS